MANIGSKMKSRDTQVKFDEKAVDHTLREIDQCRLPGAAVGIAIGGVPVYRKGFGLANMELPVVLTTKTRMRIMSTTKHFTCLAYLLLCEDGLADVDDVVGKFLPELHPGNRDVKIRYLMSNTSGLADSFGLRAQLGGVERSVPRREVLRVYEEYAEKNFAPGESFCYCNGGFAILSAIIERLSGQRLEVVLRERIFDRIGMYDSLLQAGDDEFLENSASKHMKIPSGEFSKSYFAADHWGEGGIVSTVDDILRWLANMRKPLVGSASTWELMTTAQRVKNGTATDYGLGLFVTDYRGVGVISHSGGTRGWNSQMLRVPSLDLDVVVLVNRHDVNAVTLAKRILDAVVTGLEDLPRKEGVVSEGVFRSPKSGRIIQLYAKGGEQIVSLNGGDMGFYATDAQGLRYVPEMGAFKGWVVPLGDRARPAAIRYCEYGSVDELTRVDAARHGEIRDIVGKYRSRETGTEMEIWEESGEAKLCCRGRYGVAHYRLEQLGHRLWRALSGLPPPWGGMISFDKGGMDGCYFRTFENWAIPFTRS